MRKRFLIILIVILLILVVVVIWRRGGGYKLGVGEKLFWEVQAIDTVKYSRDVAREKAKSDSFDQTIDDQVRLIAETGATHVAIGTAYDEEFVPFLRRWVMAARKYGLKVWFRGNFSGWERWFGYERISREEHLELTREFILANGDLFEEGDIFSACTECENGGPGDPRHNGDVEGHRKFLIDEYRVTREAFRKIGKNVRSNFFPMNGDVARLVMDKEMTKELGGVVVIDHYVGSVNRLESDIVDLARRSGGKVMLGEFGAPIPDIHGKLDEEEQAEWVEAALNKLSNLDELVGVNYWTSFGSSTNLWNGDGSARKVVGVVKKFYSPWVVAGVVENEIGQPIEGAVVKVGSRIVSTRNDGLFSLPMIDEVAWVEVEAEGYKKRLMKSGERIVLEKETETYIFRLRKFFATLFD